MPKRLALLATAAVLAMTPALAQQSTSPSTPSGQTQPQSSPSSPSGAPGMENKSGSSTTTTPSSQQSSASGSMAGQKFVNAQTGDQWLGSDLIGMKVTGSGNENIGTISDLLVDKDGRVMAAVIGVGGFLGIGQKDVAVSFDSLKLQRNADGNEQATLTLTKAELESAPDFKEFERPAAARPSGTSSSPSGSTPGMTKPGSK